MSHNENCLQIEVERLHAALASAIDYLRLLPRVPVTQAKIAELEKVLHQSREPLEMEFPAPWEVERFTPAGKKLCFCIDAGEIRFESESIYPKGQAFLGHWKSAKPIP